MTELEQTIEEKLWQNIRLILERTNKEQLDG